MVVDGQNMHETGLCYWIYYVCANVRFYNKKYVQHQ